MELRANYFIGQRVFILASVPYVNRYRSVDHIAQADVYGLGDLMVMGNYITLGPKASKEQQYRMIVGAGTRVPTGSTSRTMRNGELADLDLQPGTGSWGFLIHASHLLKKGKWEWSTDIVGMLNANNPNGHRYGHALNATGTAFYQWKKGTVTVAQTLGGYWEQNGNEYVSGERNDDTKGQVLYAQSGACLWYGKWALQLLWQHAVAEEHSALVPPNRERFLAGLSYAWNKD